MDTPANPNIPSVSAPPPEPPVPPIPPVNPIVNPVPTPSTPPPPPPVPSSPAYVQPPNFATFGQRFLAVLFDGLIVGVGSMILSLPFTLGTVFLGQMAKGTPGIGLWTLSGIGQLITYILVFAYSIYFIGTNGATPGKKILKIRVIKKGSPEPIGYLGAFLRESVGKLLSSFLLLGYLTMLGDKNKQTWHDKIAGTIVVHV